MIQPEVEGALYFQRDNSFIWEGTRSTSGKELCIGGHSYTLYHREWLSGPIPSLVEAPSVVVRHKKGRSVTDPA